jgi:hypothetical protein
LSSRDGASRFATATTQVDELLDERLAYFAAEPVKDAAVDS